MTPHIVLRGLRVGDIGWVAHRQGMLYAQEYGWDGTFEALVAEIAAQFVKNFDAEWESAWIAERDGQVLGSVVHASCSNDAPGVVRRHFGNKLIIGEPAGGSSPALAALTDLRAISLPSAGFCSSHAPS